MVEVTTTSLIDRIKNYMGLRGKAIVTSRNSIYPVVVVNSDQQQLPIRPPSIPVRSDVTRIMTEHTIVANKNYDLPIYTCPVGKRAFITDLHFSLGAAVTVILAVRNTGNTANIFRMASSDTATEVYPAYVIPLNLEAGESIQYLSGVGASGTVSIFGWEEPA